MRDRPTRLPALITRPMSWIYGVGARHKSRQFDRSIGVEKLDRPVISIGNLSAGGTGKTPMVHSIVRTLLELGHRPVIAMRGYKAEPGTIGDEATEHQHAFPDVPLVVQPDRINGLRALFASDRGREIDCVVLDDGFQHRQIARDLDIVLIDASRPPDRDALLPHGYLREPIDALSRADLFVLTHTEMVDRAEIDRIRSMLHAPCVESSHVWESLDLHDAHGDQSVPIDWLDARRVIGVCAIGHPHAFFDAMTRHGAEIEGRVVRSDHAIYDKTAISEIVAMRQRTNAQAIVTTQKDWVKLIASLHDFVCPVVVPRLHLAMKREDEEILRDRIISLFEHELRSFEKR